MTGYALSTLRARKRGFVGAFVALFCAAALVTACGALLETGLRGEIEPERYAGAPVLVSGDQYVHQVEVKDKGDEQKIKRKSKAIAERAWLPADTVGAVRAVPGVDAAVADVVFPAHIVDPSGLPVRGAGDHATTGHGWDSATLAPASAVDGRGPASNEEIVVDAALAERAGVGPGDQVTVQATEAARQYTVVGVAAADGERFSRSSLYFSAAEAERLSGRPDQVAAIGVIPAEGADVVQLEQDVAQALEGTTAQVHSGADRGPAEFLDAAGARVRLISMGGAMAGTSLLVAILVVVGTFALSIQQRGRELALLRAIAATPRQIRRLIGREAAVVGLVAGMLGAAAGVPLAFWLHSTFVELGAVPDTLALALSPFPMIAAVVVTVAGAWSAARVSARRMAKIRPVEALSDAAMPTRLTGWGRLLAGVLVAAGGVVLLMVLSGLDTEPASSPVTFLAVIVLATAVALLGPVIARGTVTVLGILLRLSPVGGFLATANVRANARRMAAVVTPVSLLVAMTCTVVFVQTTMGQASERQADHGILAEHTLVAAGAGIPDEAADDVRDVAGVSAVTQMVRTTVRVGLDKYPAQGITATGSAESLDLDVTAGTLTELSDDGVALSEVAAGRLDVAVGDALELTLGDGTPRTLRVVAVYARGLAFGDVTMDHDLVAAHVDDPMSSAVLVATDAPVQRADLAAAVSAHPGLQILDADDAEAARAEQQQSNAEVNYVALGLVVAFTAIAVVNTLAMSTSERVGELALLRLVGATRRQVLRMLRLESLLVVLVGVVLGTGISWATLTAFSLGMTGSAAIGVDLGVYAGIVAVAAALALTATVVPGRVMLAARPEDVLGAAKI